MTCPALLRRHRVRSHAHVAAPSGAHRELCERVSEEAAVEGDHAVLHGAALALWRRRGDALLRAKRGGRVQVQVRAGAWEGCGCRVLGAGVPGAHQVPAFEFVVFLEARGEGRPHDGADPLRPEHHLLILGLEAPHENHPIVEQEYLP